MSDRAAPLLRLQGTDVAALGVMLVAVIFTMGGGLHFALLGLRISISAPVRAMFCAGLVLFAGSYAVRDRASRAARVWDALDLQRWRDDLPLVARVAMTTRLTPVVIGLLAVATIGIGPEARYVAFNNPWLNLPARWDAEWYTEIATFGYAWDGDPGTQQSVVFFPAFPVLVRIAAALMGVPVLFAAWIVALVAFAWALLLLVRLVRRDHGEEVAATAAWFIGAYPFAVYFSAPYSESLFLLTMCAVFLSASEEKWITAAGWGLLAGLTRPNGWLLAIPLAFIVRRHITLTARRQWVTGREPRQWFAPAVALAAPLAGMLLYTFYLHLRFDDGFAWMRGQAAWGRQLRGLHLFVLDRLAYINTSGVSGYLASNPIDALNTVGAALAVGLILPITRRLGAEYGALVAVLILPPLVMGGSMSIGRMTSVLFPLFVWLARVVPVSYRPAVLVGFASLQGLCAVLFFTWRPLF